MKQQVDDVVFGNPSFEQINLVQSATEFDFLLPEIFNTPCPINTSTMVQDELRVLVEYQKEFKSLTESKIKRFEYYDRNLVNAVINFLRNYEIDATELVNEIVKRHQALFA
jgi:phenolic acid decarboxylase